MLVLQPTIVIVRSVPKLLFIRYRWYVGYRYNQARIFLIIFRSSGTNSVVQLHGYLYSVLWIRIGINADSDPAFCLNADPDLGCQTSADLDHGQILPSLKVEFF
jgi:hypothetical protein